MLTRDVEITFLEGQTCPQKVVLPHQFFIGDFRQELCEAVVPDAGRFEIANAVIQSCQKESSMHLSGAAIRTASELERLIESCLGDSPVANAGFCIGRVQEVRK